MMDDKSGRVPSEPGCEPTASAAQEGVFAESHPSRGNPANMLFVGCCYRCQKEECERHPMPDIDWRMARMFLCYICGNKRCPHATDHRHACTGSNVPGQAGSNYGHPALDAEGVAALLINLGAEHGSISAWAKSRGIHPEIALQVARRARPPAATLLRTLGLVRTVVYAPAPSDSDGSGEAGETAVAGSTEGNSAGPKDIAQNTEPST